MSIDRIKQLEQLGVVFANDLARLGDHTTVTKAEVIEANSEKWQFFLDMGRIGCAGRQLLRIARSNPKGFAIGVEKFKEGK